MTRADAVPTYTMRQLAAFVAVAETGTISAAAERMHLSQSALASALSDLEKALKAQLTVRRRARGVQLTPTGEAVLSRSRVLLHQANELQADAAGGGDAAAGPMVLGCYPSLGPTILPGLLHEFAQRHPHVDVDFREDNQNRLGAQLDGGELDVVILYDLDLPSEWQTEVLMTREPAAVLAKDHPLAGVEGPIRLLDLAEDPMILLDAPPSSKHARGLCLESGFAPRVAYRARNYETARAFVGHGLGWTLLLQRPRVDVTYEGREVVVKEIAEPAPHPVDIVAAWHRDSLLSRATRAFLHFASRHGPRTASS